MKSEPCGAKTRAGAPCKKPGAGAGGRCRLHGGATPTGIASPHTVTGRYSKYLPTRLMERYADARTDAALLELREEVALVDARLADVLGRVDAGESGATWRKLGECFAKFKKAQHVKDTVEAMAALLELDNLITAGVSDYAAWDEVQQLLEQRRRLVESERKRQVEMQQMITSERALLLFTAISETIKKHVTDRATLSLIAADLNRLVGVSSGAVIDGERAG